MSLNRVRFLPLAGLGFAFLATPAHGQGMLDRMKQKAQEKVQAKADQAADSLTQAALDKTESAVKCVISNLSCIQKAEEAGQPVIVVNAQGKSVSSADSARAVSSATKSMATAAPTAPAPTPVPAGPGTEGAEVAVNHDFTPGTRVIWATDFARDPVGDFPRRLKLYQGNFETASFQGQHLLRTTSGGEVIVPLPEVLPRQFTLEFDYTGGGAWSMSVNFQEDKGNVYFRIDGTAGIASSDNIGNSSSTVDIGSDPEGRLIHCQVMADGDYVKVYVNGKRAAQSPSAKLGRSNQLIFSFQAVNEAPAYLGNIRVAAGGKNMYEALESEGRFTTHDILFATGSATLDPRSTATLTEIGQMLKDHTDLKIEIDGHTDNVGNAAANTTLSDQRAASVKQYLVKNFQIDAGRLGSRGFGASKPVAPNTTADGRQQNRRVELVKQ